MDQTEETLVTLVRLHYAEDTRSFDQLVRNLAAGRDMSGDALMKLRDVIPDDVRMGNPLR